MLHLTYEHIYEIETTAVIVIVAVSFVASCFAIYLMGLGLSCMLERFRGKKLSYAPTVNFKNALGSAEEDCIYFSEISPSSDSLTRNVSLVSSRTNSTVSSLSDEGAKSWFAPLTSKSRKIGWKAKQCEAPPSVGLSLKFTSNDEATNQHGKLHVSVKNVASLPTKDYPRYTEAFLVLKITRVRRTLKGRVETEVHEYKTRTFRNIRDVEMEEHFVVEAKRNDIKNWCMKVTAYDQDIYTAPTELASTCIPLSQKYKDMNSRPEGAEVMAYLKPTPKNVGKLLIGLSYLPTSQRLSVNIVKAANLADMEENKIDLYAQLFLLTGVTGRSLKRKRLDFIPSPTDPLELNGTLSFDLTPNQLENVTLLIVLYMKNAEERPFQTIESTLEALDGREEVTDRCLGSVAVGKLVKNSKGKKHWRMMTMAPRRVVTIWHSLK